jgi:hypothetical protein
MSEKPSNMFEPKLQNILNEKEKKVQSLLFNIYLNKTTTSINLKGMNTDPIKVSYNI